MAELTRDQKFQIALELYRLVSDLISAWRERVSEDLGFTDEEKAELHAWITDVAPELVPIIPAQPPAKPPATPPASPPKPVESVYWPTVYAERPPASKFKSGDQIGSLGDGRFTAFSAEILRFGFRKPPGYEALEVVP